MEPHKIWASQGSVLGPTLFNMFLCNMFFMIDNADIASFADDSPSISVGKKHLELQKILQKASAKICIWFHKNGMKTNQDKCHFLSSFGINKKFWLPAYMLENSVSQKLLGVTTGRKFNFNDYVTNLCDNASKKIKYTQELSTHVPKHKNDF